jgi:small subunit ribosomal protein S20
LPNIKSAAKQARQSLVRRDRNNHVLGRLRTQQGRVEKLISAKDAANAQKELNTLFKYLDKAAGKGVIKKNAAARSKSRITLRLSALTKKA